MPLIQKVILPGIENARKAAREGIPEIYRKKFDSAINGSLRAAIDCKCLDCCAFIRKEVGKCAVYGCPLWSVRPYQDNAIPAGKPPVKGSLSEEDDFYDDWDEEEEKSTTEAIRGLKQ